VPNKKKYAVIDVFAGPGGLNEGFAQRHNSFGPFVSIEKDPVACQTLTIRKIFHLIKCKGQFSQIDYLDLIKEKESLDKFLNDPDNIRIKKIVESSVWNHELGTEDLANTCNEVKKRLKSQGWKNDIKGKDLVLIGGPPCQAYSLAGRSRRAQLHKSGRYKPELDDRNFLYQKYLELVSEFKPAIFIMENVPGILSAKVNNERIFTKVLEDLSNPTNSNKSKRLEYTLFPLTKQDDFFQKDTDFNINCELYGIPQSRKRVIIMGIRSDLVNEHVPKLEKKEAINLEEALIGLPELRSGISRKGNSGVLDSEAIWKQAVTSWDEKLLKSIEPWLRKHLNQLFKVISNKDYPFERGGEIVKKTKANNMLNLKPTLSEWIIDNSLEFHLNCSSRGHMDSDLKRYIYNSAYAESKGKAPLLKNYPEKLLPNHRSRKVGHQDRFRTLLPDKPSPTITSHISKDGHAFIHPDPVQCRSLTVREAARIQSFPDNYFFSGNRTQQYTQVGNAVPPYLAFQISDIVANILRKL